LIAIGMSPFLQQPPHDPSVAEESTIGDVRVDNVNGEFVCGRSAYF
jgi:hypothetical protein